MLKSLKSLTYRWDENEIFLSGQPRCHPKYTPTTCLMVQHLSALDWYLHSSTPQPSGLLLDTTGSLRTGIIPEISCSILKSQLFKKSLFIKGRERGVKSQKMSFFFWCCSPSFGASKMCSLLFCLSPPSGSLDMTRVDWYLNVREEEWSTVKNCGRGKYSFHYLCYMHNVSPLFKTMGAYIPCIESWKK